MEWISIECKIPEKDGRYLVVENHYCKWVGVSNKWVSVSKMREGKFDMPITHWMPLPEPPK